MKLTQYFEKYLRRESIFQNKNALQSTFIPQEINHRDEQIQTIAKILAPSLKQEKPSNLFIYGKTGTGKTLVVKHTTDQIIRVAKTKSIPLNVIYINCKLKKVADTEYRLVAQLARELGKEIPVTGLPTDEVYNTFFQALDKQKQTTILVLDEIDQLVKKAGDELIYNLTRINTELKNSQVSLIGISNDLVFSNNLDPRVKSSLSEEELVFPPYNALQLKDILQERAKQAFKENTLEPGVVEKCAAYAAREHGDARRALELLRVAGEIAERNNLEKVRIKHIDEAEEKIERDKILDAVKTHPKQFQATLYSILLSTKDKNNQVSTGEAYDIYRELCNKAGLRPLTQRRVSDIIAELDMFGIINTRVISKGRFGRTREITISLPPSLEPKIMTIIKEDLNL
jgi:cell division control protein 6